jgi:hypothetical protein
VPAIYVMAMDGAVAFAILKHIELILLLQIPVRNVTG